MSHTHTSCRVNAENTGASHAGVVSIDVLRDYNKSRGMVEWGSWSAALHDNQVSAMDPGSASRPSLAAPLYTPGLAGARDDPSGYDYFSLIVTGASSDLGMRLRQYEHSPNVVFVSQVHNSHHQLTTASRTQTQLPTPRVSHQQPAPTNNNNHTWSLATHNYPQQPTSANLSQHQTTTTSSNQQQPTTTDGNQ